ncbi:MAG: GmrSD restriction endonuclease domain-containing protein [Salinarimonas sp.]
MPGPTFKTNPVPLHELLKSCANGSIQLPDFQRSWVWDDERIRNLIASISQAFPVGAVMTLETGGEVDFKPRTIQGAEANAGTKPSALLLDGQQRLTSLYQVTMRDTVVETITPRRQKVKRWYYIDMVKALDSGIEREDAIVGVPESKLVKANFGKEVVLDLSTREHEFEALMFPLHRIFDWFDWGYAFMSYWNERGDPEKRALFDRFREDALDAFKSYQLPVITLDKSTSKEAVCLVFEKVNTGGKILDAFELVTAMYAAENFQLRDDWFARQTRLRTRRVLENVSSTDILQAIALLHSKAERKRAEAEGREPPPVSATRQSLLKLPLAAYQKYVDTVETAFIKVAKFLHGLRIYRATDLPYQSQLVPLAAILAEVGDDWEHETARRKITEWYWCGVFGELYGSTTESRFAKDIVEVPAWLSGGSEPTTVLDATFRADRLSTMRMRLSAAYKGANALLMQHGARDFRSGQEYDISAFFDESVDIHHVFPRAWCAKQGKDWRIYDSILNKTPLSARTNRILGGVAPSSYLGKLESGTNGAPPIARANLDSYLRSHLIDPDRLRTDDFEGFIEARREALLTLIESAMGQRVYRGSATDEPEDDADEAPDEENLADTHAPEEAAKIAEDQAAE